MRGLATATMLGGLLWQAYWIARILWGAQGTVPLLAFVGGLLAISTSLACLSQLEHSLGRRLCVNPVHVENRKVYHCRNGHNYSLTYPNIPKPYQRGVR